MSGNQCSRRDFLNQLGWVATLGTFGGLISASGRYMFPDVLYEPPKAYKLGRMEDYPEGVVFLPDKRLFVVREQNLIKAVSAVCTHIGCTVRWVPERNRWECPCHGSTFSKEGQVTAGPARRTLPWYEVTLAADGRLFVNERRIVPFSQTLAIKT